MQIKLYLALGWTSQVQPTVLTYPLTENGSLSLKVGTYGCRLVSSDFVNNNNRYPNPIESKSPLTSISIYLRNPKYKVNKN